MKQTKKRVFFDFLNNGLGAELILGRICKFLHVDGNTIIGKLVRAGKKNVVVRGEAGKTETEIYRTTQVLNVTPSKKVGGSKKGKK